MARREFVQLAQHLDFNKHKLANGIWSPKLDGMRGIWDGGITMGLNVRDVPWANVLRDTKDKFSTGLWSRLGKPINAHPDWLKFLPVGVPLDGELYLGKQSLEDTMAVKADVPEWSLWKDVTFQVFDTPSRAFWQDGDVVYDSKTRKQVVFNIPLPTHTVGALSTFEERKIWLDKFSLWNSAVVPVPQTKLSDVEHVARQQLDDAFNAYVDDNGEGLMVRLAESDLWLPRRVATLLKYKPEHESEAIVTGYYAGEIGKRATLLGLLGSLEVSWRGHTFTLSGFTHGERVLTGRIQPNGPESRPVQTAHDWAYNNPGKKFPESYSLERFPLGSSVPFKYTSTTAAGVPREARYDRPEA